MHSLKEPPAKLAFAVHAAPELGPVIRLGVRWWFPYAFALAYLVFAELGHWLFVKDVAWITLWPASGLYIGALIVAPFRRWPVLVALAFAAHFGSDALLHGMSPVISAGYGVATGAEALAGAWLTRRLSGFAPADQNQSFHDRMRDALALLAGAVVAGPALGASIGTGLLYEVADMSFISSWALWFASDALNVLVMTPLMLSPAGPRHARAKTFIDFTAAALGAGSLAAISIFILPLTLRVAYLAFPAMVWGAIRLGTSGAAAALLGATAVMATGAALGADYFVASPAGRPAEIIRYQAFLSMAGATCYLLAATLAEREEALRRAESAESWLTTVIDAVPPYVWSALPDGRIDYVNRRGRNVVKAGTDQISALDWKAIFHPDDWGHAGARWQHSLTTGETFLCEYRRLMPDGSYRWMLSRAQPTRAQDGTITRWFGTCTDITEIVEARGILARSREELDNLVAERTRALQETQARLAQAQRMEALGQLAGGIAHDFNNVIQAVQGGASLLQCRAEEPAAVRRLSHMVQDAAERGASITRRLLTFSRRSDLTAEPVDAAALLASMQDILAHTLGTGVTIQVTPSTNMPRLLADKSQLETALVNLATNARDAMAGNGTLTLAAVVEPVPGEADHERPANLQPGTYVRLSVSDTGAGMHPTTLARVTEPFFTTKPVGQGTGLGLAMAKGFAEQSGGGLQIESTPGHGTVVSLWFPAADSARSGNTRPEYHSSPVDKNKRIRLLLVDDDSIVRKIIAEEMEEAGYSVLQCESPAGALALLDAGETVALVISDLSMPDMDGIALIHEVQRRRIGLPAILLTGFALNDVELALAGAVSGAFTLLRKPIGAKALAERVAMALQGKAPAQTTGT